MITKRDLALRGTAEIILEAPKDTSVTDDPSLPNVAEAKVLHLQRLRSAGIAYAVGPPDRPWNSYRTHSRAARDLDEYKSSDRAKTIVK